ncbi:transketolase [Zychaea mexicana]|uniref:transketolase n=1 Tax=Zychaea mexicana TaxID=64656 RepID=UPI0022FF0978|nr:transketolase [Zychaea mexicana]KAI9496372.1 transketolase [Zychaea mexicana]
MVQTVDQRAVNTVRVLAADMTRAANSGHPGGPMGGALMGHVLFSKFLNVSPRNTKFINRDRFVLSNGHCSALQYILLHLLGYDLSMQDLKNFRQLGSKTPGHPEATETPGLEVTTGPLGQGISNAVGLAAAQAHLEAVYNRPDYEIFNNYTYVILGDGCLMEGVALEAVSLAGHWKLGKLICLYDANNITIDGELKVQFSEDAMLRLEACGWHILVVEDGNNDLEAVEKAIEEAKAVKDKPTMIKIKTTIGFGSLIQNEPKVHGAPLSVDDIKQLKEKFGFNPDETFVVPQEVRDLYDARLKQLEEQEKSWNALFDSYSKRFPTEAAEIQRRFSGAMPEGWHEVLPTFSPNDPAMPTRKASEIVLNALSDVIPDIMCGSADVTPSNLTRWKTATTFQHPSTELGDFSGRYILYGVREHAMFAIMNGMACYGGIVPLGGTYLQFMTYGWGSIRLAALMEKRAIYIMTHDSIGLGEDGPTHQPIESLALTRSTPNLLTFRPSDANEVCGSYWAAMNELHRPSVLSLSRHALPNLKGSSAEGTRKGAYILEDQENAQVILLGTGSETSIAVEAAKTLGDEGIATRVVSMPCTELYDEQSDEYKKSVFTPGVPVISIEALGTWGWERYAHVRVGMRNRFGASAPYKQLYEKFNITADALVKKAKLAINHFNKIGYVPDLNLDL